MSTYKFMTEFTDGRRNFVIEIEAEGVDDAYDQAMLAVKGIDEVGYGCDEWAVVSPDPVQ